MKSFFFAIKWAGGTLAAFVVGALLLDRGVPAGAWLLIGALISAIAGGAKLASDGGKRAQKYVPGAKKRL